MASSPPPFQQLMAACDQAEQLREAETQAWTVDSLSTQVHAVFLTRGEALPMDTCREAAQRVLAPVTETMPVISLDKPEPTAVTPPAPVTPSTQRVAPPVRRTPEEQRRFAVTVLMVGGAMTGLPFLLDLANMSSDGSGGQPYDALLQSFSTMAAVVRYGGLAALVTGGFLLLKSLND